MRKSNVIITAVIIVASIIFLCLWYALGFNLVDDPLDLVLTIVWWVIVAVICVAIQAAENRRKRTIRTAFLAPSVIYNSEAGIIRMEQDEKYVPVLQKMLSNLDYNFDTDAPDTKTKLRFNYIVRTNKFKDGGRTWEGHVVKISDPNHELPFANKSELAQLLS